MYMKRRTMFVEKFAKVNKVFIQDLCCEYNIDERAANVMMLMKGEVSDGLLRVLVQELQGFCERMQLEMAEDLLDFTLGHVVHTTGCKSVDLVLDYCYTHIAIEHDIMIELEN